MDMQQPVGQSAPAGGMPGTSPSGEKSSAGPVIGSIIVIVILIVGAIYFWGAKLSREEAVPAGEADQTTAALRAQGSSDEVGAIESDLDATELEGLDADFSELEAQL
ncbi:MAG: hypothetical protein G01um101472_423 [Parcubacteria group bacterium Gr01-1014_72]|nr:MAG: hypothetical protein G01um101472_423 [Parcubacteria group bacterium Gr01-1014_72]